MSTFSVVALQHEHIAQLPHFLALAAQEDTVEAALQSPDWARYICDWGRQGDTSVVALNADEQVIGMAWARLWNDQNRGFGFVDELTPEMTVAVLPDFQGQGVGTALVEALSCRLRALRLAARWDARHQKMVPIHQSVEVDQPEMEISPRSFSVSVRAGSSAQCFYEKCGFEPIEGTEHPNHIGSMSQIWQAHLHQGGNWRSGEMDRSVNVNWAGAPDDFVSINFYYNLKFSLFDDNDWARFYELMRSLPGRDSADLEMDGIDEINNWAYFGPSPIKAAVHWSHLYASRKEGDLLVRGDVAWDEWCAWDEAFSWAARGLPHGLKQENSPELRELRAYLEFSEKSAGHLAEENRRMRLRLRELGETAFG